MNGPMKKRSLGRRKIEMKKIEKKPNLQVTFTKRRAGLFKKASELALLCGAHVAVLVQSPSGKIYTCGNHVDALIHSFLAEAPPPPEIGPHWRSSAYDEAVMSLEMEKRQRTESWWTQESFEGLEVHQLEEYLEALTVLTHNISKTADQIITATATANSSTSYDDGLSVDDYQQLYDMVFNY